MEQALYGFTLGAQLLKQRQLRLALPYLIKPVNYWRTVEYELVLGEGDFHSGQRVLDIGSPKLLSLYLAEKVGAEVWSTDIEPYFLEKLEVARLARNIPSDRVHFEIQDGRKLTYPEGHFDRVYSISVLEHIPEQGDSDCAREIARVLKPGGRAVLTVPFWPTSRDEYRHGGFYWAGSSKSEDGRGVFYQRRYSEEDLHRRLVEPSGLRLRTIQYVGERVPTPKNREFSDFLPRLTGPIQPLLSKMMHVGPVQSWRELSKPLCALVSLEK